MFKAIASGLISDEDDTPRSSQGHQSYTLGPLQHSKGIVFK